MDTKSAGKKLLQNTEKTIRGTLLGSSSRIIKATPVVSGRLMGNWQPSLNTPTTGTTTKTTSGLSEVAATLSRIKLGDIFYLSNNLPYAYPVELRTGMVRIEVARLKSAIL